MKTARLNRVLATCSMFVLASVVSACGAKDKPADSPATANTVGGNTAVNGATPPGYPANPGATPPGYPVNPGATPPGYPVNPGATPPGYPANPGSATGTPTGTPGTTTGTATATPNDPVTQLMGQLATAGTAFLQPGGQGDLAEKALQTAATRYAPGMSAEGEITRGTLTEGGHQVFLQPMQPGKCYTFIAVSPTGGITNINLNLFAPPLYNIGAGQDGMNGATAVVGSTPSPMCPIIPITLQYKVDISAQKGAGVFAARVYSRVK